MYGDDRNVSKTNVANIIVQEKMMEGSHKHCENVINGKVKAAVSVTEEILKFWHSLFIKCLCSLLNKCAWGLEEKENTNYKKKYEKKTPRGGLVC